MSKVVVTKKFLDGLYKKYNRREFIHPDPLEFLYNYPAGRDREIAGLIASSLAYGRVSQILKSVALILNEIGDSPHSFLMNSSNAAISKKFAGFKHRFTKGEDIAALLKGIKRVITKYGSLQKCFASGISKKDATFLPALLRFTNELKAPALLPSTEKGSACKRLNLFLRWMIRRDDVDPGGWHGLPANKLIVPLDTHMHKIGNLLGFTKRRQANLKTAIEITEAFSSLSPQDPVKYDFALTRFGIRKMIFTLP